MIQYRKPSVKTVLGITKAKRGITKATSLLPHLPKCSRRLVALLTRTNNALFFFSQLRLGLFPRLVAAGDLLLNLLVAPPQFSGLRRVLIGLRSRHQRFQLGLLLLSLCNRRLRLSDCRFQGLQALRRLPGAPLFLVLRRARDLRQIARPAPVRD